MNTRASIIIIEDEKNICNFIETVLTPQNYQVTCAYTGTDGLKLINTHKPDVVLLDLGLPDMDGLEIIQEVRAYSSVPIIVISARTMERSKVAALDMGADDYLTNRSAQRSFWPASARPCATASAMSAKTPNTTWAAC